MESLRETIHRVENSIKSPEIANTEYASFNSIDWQKLVFGSEDSLPEGFEIGRFGDAPEKYIPALVPFSEVKGLAFSLGRASDFPHFNDMLEKSFCRVIGNLPANSYEILLIDGKNDGVGFNYISRLKEAILGHAVITDQDEITNALEKLLHREDGNWLFILINNFPHGFTNQSAAKLYKLVRQRNDTLMKVLMTKDHHVRNSVSDLDSGISEALAVLIVDENGVWQSNELARLSPFEGKLRLSTGSTFSAEEIISVIETASAMHQSHRAAKMDHSDIDIEFSVRIGESDGRQANFTLGQLNSSYHAIVAGRSGKGKTVLLDNIITNAANTYTPDELRIVLLDMKGVEFHEYSDLPHIQAFCSSSEIDKGINVIKLIDQEIAYREKALREAKASDFARYKALSGNTMPRLLIIIDEFQNLFAGNFKSDGYVEEILIKKVLRLGRAYGIHLICCTQSLGDGVRSSFLNNIPLRIAFQMTRDQSQHFLSIGNSSAERLKVGEIVYNEQDGIASSNKLVKVDYLTGSDIQTRVKSSIGATQT